MDIERAPLGGADPGADYSGAATLASVRLSRVTLGGYSPAQVEDLRRRALNTIAYLEAQVEALQVQLQGMRAALEAGFGPVELARGLVFLAKALRDSFGEGQDLERAWAAEELAVIVSGPPEASDEHARVFPSRLAELVGPPPAGRKLVAGQFVAATSSVPPEVAMPAQRPRSCDLPREGQEEGSEEKCAF